MTTTSSLPGPPPITTPSAPAAGPHAAAVRRLPWAWPVAILLGFPIGGLVANLIVGKIDTAAAALAGGLIAGGIIGAAQWLALRPLVPWLWVVATSAGMAAGLTVGAVLVDYGISREDLALMGAITGLGVGGLQAVILAPRVSGALWWAALNPPAWALAWLVTSFVITSSVKEHYTNFGAGGALVYALLTWLLLKFLFQANERESQPVERV